MAVVAVIGAGAIGCFYGAQLRLAGHEVRLLLRRDAARVRMHGLTVLQTPTDHVASTLSRPRLDFAPGDLRACATPEEAGAGDAPDWVLIGLKAGAYDALPALLPPLLGPRTRVVVLTNGLGVEEAVARVAPAERVFGMLCFICVNRDDDGTIRHLAYGRVGIGHLGDDPVQVADLAALIGGAGIACDAPPCLREARWRKLVWNVPFNGLSVVGGGDGLDTRAMLDAPALRERAARLMREVVVAADADLAAAGRRERIEPGWIDEQFARTERMGPYLTSTLLDWRAGRALELEYLFLEPLRRARRLGVPTPELAALADALVALARGRGQDVCVEGSLRRG